MRRTILLALAILVVPGLANATPTFDTTSKLGAAVNSNLDEWVCALDSQTSIVCGVYPSGGSFSWCAASAAFQNGHTAAASLSGVYLVPNFQVAGGVEQVAFVVINDGSYFRIERIMLDSGENDCTHRTGGNRDVDDSGRPPQVGPAMMGNLAHPDMSPKLAIAKGSGGNVFLFNSIPSSDMTSAGEVIAAKVPNDGTGGIAWQWVANNTAGVLANSGNKYKPGSAMDAKTSSITGEPTVALFDANNTRMVVLFNNNAGAPADWDAVTSAPQPWGPYQFGSAIAVAPVAIYGTWNGNTPSNLDIGDEVIAVAADGIVYTDRLSVLTGMPDVFATFYDYIGMGGVLQPRDQYPLTFDHQSDSLVATNYSFPNNSPSELGNIYARDDNSSAAQILSDFDRTPPMPLLKECVSANNGSTWPATTDFVGNDVLFHKTNGGDDILYAVCTSSGNSYVCRMVNTPNGTLSGFPGYTWARY